MIVWLLYWLALLIGFIVEGIAGAILFYFFWFCFTAFLFWCKLGWHGKIVKPWNAYLYLLRSGPMRNLEFTDETPNRRITWPLWWHGINDDD